MFSFARADREYTNDEVALLENLAQQYHLNSLVAAKLSAEEIEAAAMRAKYNAPEAAEVIGISLPGLNKRLASLRAKLDAQDTTHAIVILKESGVI